ncbi:MAG TPA: DsbA family protein [Thermoflexales bacterium]|nr:DsbA family protein [Thermoflexales bacterium]HQW36523.1 DsbA family protein [Thermoflexales bacterium]HQZ21301.1 DsbA family protein [Thermoflexales bacterium]HRA01205.1 DsbA family protein [Thermoflexales bacterium]
MENPNYVPSPAPSRAPVGWFAFGILVGAALATGLLVFGNFLRAPAAQSYSLDDIRAAAKAGAADAIASELANAQDSIGPAAPQAQATPVVVQNIALRTPNTMGNANAKVTIIEYSDFQCPYCLSFHQQTYQKIIDQYVKTGKVKLAYKQMPIASIHPMATPAAIASECAADQGKFWEYHDTLFNKLGAGQLDVKAESLTTYAKSLGLDTDKFQSCLKDGAAQARVTSDTQEGAKIGVRGTPTFVINGQLLVGAQPFSAFQQAIDAALATN